MMKAAVKEMKTHRVKTCRAKIEKGRVILAEGKARRGEGEEAEGRGTAGAADLFPYPPNVTSLEESPIPRSSALRTDTTSLLIKYPRHRLHTNVKDRIMREEQLGSMRLLRESVATLRGCYCFAEAPKFYSFRGIL